MASRDYEQMAWKISNQHRFDPMSINGRRVEEVAHDELRDGDDIIIDKQHLVVVAVCAVGVYAISPQLVRSAVTPTLYRTRKVKRIR